MGLNSERNNCIFHFNHPTPHTHTHTHTHRSTSDELHDLWSSLEATTGVKGQKLRDAVEGQEFYRAVKDVDLWLEDVEKQLASEDVGKVTLGTSGDYNGGTMM